jgi:hypothetical protein
VKVTWPGRNTEERGFALLDDNTPQKLPLAPEVFPAGRRAMPAWLYLQNGMAAAGFCSAAMSKTADAVRLAGM